MQVLDVIVVIGVVATIIQTGYIAKTYHSAGRISSHQPQPTRRHFLVMSSFALISWAVVAFDYYDRHHHTGGNIVLSWGAQPDLTFYMNVNTIPLLEYRDSHKLVLTL